MGLRGSLRLQKSRDHWVRARKIFKSTFTDSVRRPCRLSCLSALTSWHLPVPSFPSAPSQLHPQVLTLLPHASLAAFAKATLLALATHIGIHGAVAPTVADVACPFDDTAAEESLATFATQHVVVEARCLVSTHTAQLIPQHFGGWPLFPLLWTELWIQRSVLMFFSKERAWCPAGHCPEHSVLSAHALLIRSLASLL